VEGGWGSKKLGCIREAACKSRAYIKLISVRSDTIVFLFIPIQPFKKERVENTG
jgi:hypothetical protein